MSGKGEVKPVEERAYMAKLRDTGDHEPTGTGRFLVHNEGVKVTLLRTSEAAHEICERVAKMVKGTQSIERDIPFTEAEAIAQELLMGGGLPVPLESISFTFLIENVSRACTHQIVRTRIGAGFNQQSLRWCNLGNFDVRMPLSIASDAELCTDFHELVERSRKLYQKCVDRDVPYQDARFTAPMGTVTWLYATYNYQALRSFCATRLCEMVQWEINEVARQMKQEVTRKSWASLGLVLRPRCESLGKCVFRGWEESCGKYPARDWESGEFGQSKCGIPK